MVRLSVQLCLAVRMWTNHSSGPAIFQTRMKQHDHPTQEDSTTPGYLSPGRCTEDRATRPVACATGGVQGRWKLPTSCSIESIAALDAGQVLCSCA